MVGAMGRARSQATRWWHGPAILAAILLVAASAPTRARAQGLRVTTPLLEHGPAAPLRVQHRDRLQLGLSGGATIGDDFAQTALVGLEANMHATEYLGFGLWLALGNLGGAFTIDTGLTDQVARGGARIGFGRPQLFPRQIMRIGGLVAGQAVLTPVRIEIPLGDGLGLDLEPQLITGAAAVLIEERADCATPATCASAQTARQLRVAPAFLWGAAIVAHLGDVLALGVQWRALAFEANLAGMDFSGRDENGDPGGGFPDQRIDAADRELVLHHAVLGSVMAALPGS